ncbi:hypothetical protein [uncultured Flavobacterium sp.]|uniref:hypothetical protein n=1 Tax=uncultured Flavobacterium sp. TaxID=165435 RepID=UPI0030EE3988|tara:strand:+ start:1609 stop:2115 length:507 start_codon:yes stop_codon:yes gene_type:complete
MIETLTYLRYVLVVLIPVAILIGVYFGVKQSLNVKYIKKAILSLVTFFSIPVLILLLNIFLENLILNDIKKNLKNANFNNSEITINGKQTNVTIKGINDLISKMDYSGHLMNRTHDLEPYKITIYNYNKDNYSFTFYRNSEDSTLYRLYTNEYNYELELSNVNTDIFK